MKRQIAIAGSAIFLVLVPGTVAFYIPWMFTHWRIEPPLLGFYPFRVIGVLLILAGVPLLLDAFVRFALQGLGTPAPVAPPQHLVVTGVYRFVRNPMYVAIVLLTLGQGLLFNDGSALRYPVYLWLGFTAFIMLYEEPTLRRKFGREYARYCAQVPRWLPRFKPYPSGP